MQCETPMRSTSSPRAACACDRVSEIGFRDRTVAGNARFLIIHVGSPHIVGGLRACAHRANCQQRLGFFIEIHDPSIWTAPLRDQWRASFDDVSSPYFSLW